MFALKYIRYIKTTLIFIVFVFLAYQIHKIFNEFPIKELSSKISIPLASGSLFLTLMAMMVSATLWYYLLVINGAHISFKKCLPIFFYSHIGRYLPGKFWVIFGKIFLTSKSGIPVGIAAQSTILETMIGIMAGLMLAVTIFPFLNINSLASLPLLIVATVVIAASLHPRIFGGITNFGLKLFGKPLISVHYSYRQILVAFMIQILGWEIFGLAFYLLIVMFYPESDFPIFASAGVFAASWLIGFLSLLTPAGLGVREAILVLALSKWLPLEPATIVALSSRLLTTVADLSALILLMIIKKMRLL